MVRIRALPAAAAPAVVATHDHVESPPATVDIGSLTPSLSTVSVQGRVQRLSGVSASYPMLTFRIADATGTVDVKCSGPTLAEAINVDDCVLVAHVTVHKAWGRPGLEVHYEDGQGPKRRRSAATSLCRV